MTGVNMSFGSIREWTCMYMSPPSLMWNEESDFIVETFCAST